jgi:heptosyltransferase-2
MPQERILIRGLNWLGDAIMCLPALTRLREARPDAQISILTPRKLADLWSRPLIDTVLPFEKEDNLLTNAWRLRAGRFSTGLVLPTSLRSAMELWLAGIPTRIGAEYRGRGVFLSHSVHGPAGIAAIRKRSEKEIRGLAARSSPCAEVAAPEYSHHVYRYLRIVSVLGANEQPIPPKLAMEDDETRKVLSRFALEPDAAGSPLFAMCPGSEYGASKRWPEQRFIEAARALHEKTGCRWLLLGTSGEAAVCERIVRAVCCNAGNALVCNLAGQTSLRELAALLKACSLLLGNDSGPMHLAASVGTPVAGVFSSTSAAITGPGLPGDRKHLLLTSTAPCSPCFLRECPIDLRCMDSLEVKRVIDGIMEMRAARW